MTSATRLLVWTTCCLALIRPAWSAETFDLAAAQRTLAISNQAQLATLKRLQSSDLQTQTSAVADTLRDGESATPAVLYAMASALAEEQRMPEAVFWYHVGKMRLQFDLIRNRDRSLGDLPTVLAMQLPKELLQAAYSGKPADILSTTKAAIDWDNRHAHHYNPLWPTPHGLGVFKPGEQGLAPQSQWEEMNHKVHEQWLNAMTKVAEHIKATTSHD